VSALLRHGRYVLGENPVTAVAFGLFVGLVLLALVGPWLAPHDPLASDTARTLQPPSARHWFGTDQIGRDILSRVLVATRLDLAISLSAVALSFAAGSLLGACAGFFGGWTDRIVTRVTDTIMAFPLFVLAMGIVAALGNTLANIVYATAIINLPFYARMARAEVNVRREAGFVEAARLSGNGSARILAVHVFPNCLPPMMVQASLNLGWAILNTGVGHHGRRGRCLHRLRRVVDRALPRAGADAGGLLLQSARRRTPRPDRSSAAHVSAFVVAGSARPAWAVGGLF